MKAMKPMPIKEMRTEQMGPPRQCQLFERGEKPEEQRPESLEPGGLGRGQEGRELVGQEPERMRI